MVLTQLVSPSKLAEAQASIQAGADGVRDGVAALLDAIAEYAEKESTGGGVNGSQVHQPTAHQLIRAVCHCTDFASYCSSTFYRYPAAAHSLRAQKKSKTFRRRFDDT